MTNEDLDISIAGLQGFETPFVVDSLVNVIWDGDCKIIPKYVEILGKQNAEQFYRCLLLLHGSTFKPKHNDDF